MKNMKRLNNILRYALFGAAGVFLLASCSDKAMDKVNQNPNNPSDVPSQFTLLELAAATATHGLGSDLSLYASVYMELEAGVHGQMFNAEIRSGEPTTSATYNNNWGSLYTNINNAKDIIAKCVTGGSESGNTRTLAIAQTLEAINLAQLTNLFGDVPYSQTSIYDENGMPVYPQPVIDKQEVLYASIFKLLDDAEANFNATPSADYTAGPGAYDLIYEGSTSLWIKAINALRARYKMQLLNRSSSVTADLNQIVQWIDNSFADVSEQMSFNHYDGGNNYNPLFSYMYSRDGLGVSQSFLDKTVERNDPRLTFVAGYDADSDPEDIFAAPNGEPVEAQFYYDITYASYSHTAAVHYISYHELLFIKAEALARLGQTADAKATLSEAVAAAYANLDITNVAGAQYTGGSPTRLTAELAAGYFEASVSPAFDVNPVKEVMFQKYMACFGANGEPVVAYNDYRRMKAMGEGDYITLANHLNPDQFPLRFTYGNDDVLNNTNIKEAYGDGRYVYSENVWWAGGTR